VALEIGPRTLSIEDARAVAEALGELDWPALKDLETLFRPVKDAYLQSELDALYLSGPGMGDPVRRMTLGRKLQEAVVLPTGESAGGGSVNG
jgi:hypothetical protein